MMDRGWWSYLRYDEQRDRPAVSRALLRRVLGYARPYSRRIALMLFIISLSTGLALIPPLLQRSLIDDALARGDYAHLHLLALGMIAVPVLIGLLGVAQRYLGASVGEGIIFDLRCALFAHVQRMSLRFFTDTKTGELMSRLNNDVVGAQQTVTTTMVNLFSNVLSLVATLVVMLALEWRLTLVAVALLPLFVLPARRVGNILRGIAREQMTANGQLSALMNETLGVSGALLVKLFGRAPAETARFAERAVRVRDLGIRNALVGRWFFLGLSLVSAVGTALVFWLGGVLVLQGVFTVGTIVAFGAYLTQLYGPLSSLTNARVEFATSLVSFERVFETLDLPVEIADRPGAIVLQAVAGEVRFEHVSFSYQEAAARGARLAEVSRWRSRSTPSLAERPASSAQPGAPAAGARPDQQGANGTASVDTGAPGAPEPNGANGVVAAPADAAGAASVTKDHDGTLSEPRWALRDASFTVRPGQLAALVGPSGAGKTTITYLLPRLYDPTEGRVLVDGHDLRDVTLDSLTAQIGMVTQEPYLFHDTIRANLLYARPDATPAELEAACRAANIHEFIAGLPDGYDTIVGERGYRLSGGEKQRLAIARVLLKDPRILVLDEATSHLDSQSEALIQAALERAMQGRTSLVIAHRLSTILAADVILVLDRGRLIERGTHAELLAQGGLYANLFETQFRPAALAGQAGALTGAATGDG
ncbi:MAG TPA: ABC transporter ATP-binding protein [Chloroflexota bacterium]|nr:ABC transporter ATP-binding protein [Chloroflexota bacterium]